MNRWPLERFKKPVREAKRVSQGVLKAGARGFSLIEVLVALAVLGIALGAAVQAVGQQARHATYLRDRTLAHWVAMNQAAEQRIQHRWPSPGLFQGEARMAGRSWYWDLAVVETQSTDIRRLNVAVFKTFDRSTAPVARLEAYLPRP